MFHLPLENDRGNRSDKGRRISGWEDLGKRKNNFERRIKTCIESSSPKVSSHDERINFQGVAFPYGFDFTRLIGQLSADFSNASFSDHTSFSNLAFNGPASFDKAKFEGWTFFVGTNFGKFVSFSGAKFGIFVDFSNSLLGGTAIFTDVTFTGAAWFKASRAKDTYLDFLGINFLNAEFGGQVSFENRRFTSSTSFDNVTFKDRVTFHGCELHQGMSFHKARFLKTKDWDDQRTVLLEQSYRTLKLGMETLRARNEEVMFFALEMDCRRQRSDVPRLERWTASLYKSFSDYGQSLSRPLYWLGGITVFIGALYFYLLWAMASPPPTHIWGGAPELTSVITFTLEQMFRPFFVWSTSMTESFLAFVKAHPLLIPILASLQSLATIALLTLSLLALRRRFKMD